MWIWDLILSLAEEVQTFSGRQFKAYDMLYALARYAITITNERLLFTQRRITTGGLLVSSLGFLGDVMFRYLSPTFSLRC